MNNQSKIFILLIFVFTIKQGLSQNLVPNPSFEQITNMPCNYSEFNGYIVNWYKGTIGSADLWSTLNDISCETHSPHDNNFILVSGQYPRTGNNFSGILTDDNSGEENYREYVSIQLTSPLQPHYYYKVRFYISLADNGFGKASNIDAYLSKDNPYYYSNHIDSSRIIGQPQIRSYDFMSDSINWVEISAVFSPNDTMNYITIGNFFDDANSTFGPDPDVWYIDGSYYFIDDVSVEEVDIWVTGDTTICLGDTATLFANGNDTVSWALSSDTTVFFSTDTVVNVAPTQTTIYWLYGPQDTVPYRVFVDTTQLYLGQDTTLCNGDTLTLNANYSGFTNLWFDNSTDTLFSTTNAGTYWIEIQNNACIRKDTINVNINYEPYVDLGNDTTICNGSTVVIDASQEFCTFYWSNGSLTPAIDVMQEGYYWVDVSKGYCTNRDSIYINVVDTPNIFLGNDTTLCPNDILILNAYFDSSTYLWDFYLTTDSIFVVTEADKYIVNVTNACGTTSEEINIDYSSIAVDLGNDTSLYSNQSILLDAGTGYTYLWNDLTTNQTLFVNAGSLSIGNYNYWVEISDTVGCMVTDTMYITILMGVGIENTTNENIKIYPNPTQGTITVELDNFTNNCSYSIITTDGLTIEQGEKYSSKFELNFKNKGIYYLKLKSDDETTVSRIVVY